MKEGPRNIDLQGDYSLSVLPSNWLRKLSTKCHTATDTVLNDAVMKFEVEKGGPVSISSEERALIAESLTLFHYIQHVSSMHELYLQSEVNVALETALVQLRPKYEENMPAFREVERLVREISQFLSDPLLPSK